jgi:hypothetical protein
MQGLFKAHPYFPNCFVSSDGFVKIVHKTGRETIKKGTKNGEGYFLVRVGYKTVSVHRLVVETFIGCIDKKMQVDHVNGNRGDNTLENLRIVTHRDNCLNKETHRKGRLQGVSFCKKTGKYRARICIGNDRIWLGTFDNEQDAHDVYKTELNKLGETICKI